MLLCVSCRQPRDYTYFIKHPNEILDTYEKCWVDRKQQVVVEEECLQVAKAANAIKILLLSLQADGQGYGLKIMKTQGNVIKHREQIKIIQVQMIRIQSEEKKSNPELILLRQKLNKEKNALSHDEAQLLLYWSALKFRGLK